MGEVYRARDTRLNRTVAIKVMPASLAADPEFRERFEREARTLSRIEHPHICPLYDVGNENGVAYLVMQYLEGETLATRLARGPLDVDQALRIAASVGDALDVAHRHGVAHRDLKPGNIMLTKTGVRLLDFGLAKQRVIGSATTETMIAAEPPAPVTGRGTILGTLHYMAPEQLKGIDADARSDVYALGIVLYEMLAGRRPFEAADSASLIASILEHPVPPLPPLAAISPRLDRAIQTAVAKDPDDRWQSCRDFSRELTWIGQEGVPASAATRVTSRVRLVALGLAVIAALTLGGWYASSRAKTPVNATPVVVLMDSAHPQRVYDEATLKAGGTNADDLTDQLRDLPVVLLKETTGPSWHREDQVLTQNPDVVVVHRSCFYDSTLLADLPLNKKYFTQLYPPAADKLETLLGYVGLGNPRTRFVVYSRGSWATEEAKAAWVMQVERRFPRLQGRITAYKVPLDRATFRNPATAAELKQIVIGVLAAVRGPS